MCFLMRKVSLWGFSVRGIRNLFKRLILSLVYGKSKNCEFSKEPEKAEYEADYFESGECRF